MGNMWELETLLLMHVLSTGYVKNYSLALLDTIGSLFLVLRVVLGEKTAMVWCSDDL
jgi:hypothetical protein